MALIDADDQSTWPASLLDILARHSSAIRSYHAERAAIDRKAEVDVMLRIHRPANQHAPAWKETLQVAANAVRGQYLRGYHATRLTDDEIKNIQASGLEVLSVDLLSRRLAAIRDAGHFEAGIFEALSERHQAADDNRANKIWFVFTKVCMRDEGGMERFFRSWGGEALYNSHERHSVTGPALRLPGTPAIVQASVPCDGIETFMEVGTRLVNIWCSQNRIKTDHAATFEGYVRENIPASAILRIDLLGSDVFEGLTGQKKWRKPLAH